MESRSSRVATPADLLAFMASRGPLKTAYAELRKELPSELCCAVDECGIDVHSLVLESLGHLLASRASAPIGKGGRQKRGRGGRGGDADWPGSSAAAYCALLVQALQQLKRKCPPVAKHVERATVLCGTHPSFFRKLASVYDELAAGALDAARMLWKQFEDAGPAAPAPAPSRRDARSAAGSNRGDDAAQVALLIAEYSLERSFDLCAVLGATLDANELHAATELASTDPKLCLWVLEELVRRGNAQQAKCLLPRLRLGCAVPVSLLRDIRCGLLAQRLRWLARSGHWDLIDGAFADVKRGLDADVERGRGRGDRGGAAEGGSGGGAVPGAAIG